MLNFENQFVIQEKLKEPSTSAKKIIDSINSIISDKKQTKKIRSLLQDLCIFRIEQHQIDNFLSCAFKILSQYDNEKIIRLTHYLITSLGKLDLKQSTSLYNQLEKEIKSTNIGNQILSIHTLGTCLCVNTFKESFLNYLIERMEMGFQTQITPKKKGFSKKSKQSDDYIFLQTACLKVAAIRFPRSQKLKSIVLKLMESKDEEAVRLSINLFYGLMNKNINMYQSLMGILPTNATFESKFIVKKKHTKKKDEKNFLQNPEINLTSIQSQSSFLRLIEKMMVSIPKEAKPKFYNAVLLVMKYNINLEELNTGSRKNEPENSKTNESQGEQSAQTTSKVGLTHQMKHLEIFLAGIGALSSGENSWEIMHQLSINHQEFPLNKRAHNFEQFSEQKYSINDFILQQIYIIISRYNFQLRKSRSSGFSVFGDPETTSSKIDFVPEKNPRDIGNAELVGTLRALCKFVTSFNSSNPPNKFAKNLSIFHPIQNQLYELASLSKSPTIKMWVVCSLICSYQPPHNLQSQESAPVQSQQTQQLQNVYEFQNQNSFKILQEIIIKEIKKKTFTPHLFNFILKTFEERLQITPKITPVALSIFQKVSQKSIELFESSLLVSHFEKIIQFNSYNRILMETIIIILDSDPKPEFFLTLKNIKSKIIHFVGNQIHKILGLSVDSLYSPLAQDNPSTNAAKTLLDSIILRLKHFAILGDYDLQIQSILAIWKIRN
ncbi:hypothetical protein M0811_05573 [Anaeramoeba ignava]|uniref:Uncharacterized protein n=1 Tax=Anaeramoeba ignava TaxID=1746090 RepID=A0A9Q0LRX1_ANAIG|nr:hypothetical protein M0811_05573 [Anaeramoeba ignava]